MAARRCSLCAINYPTSVMRCHVCDEPAGFISDANPDEDWKAAVELAAALQPSTEAEKVEWWRLRTILKLGYDLETAESLAASDADLHDLARLIRDGCSLELAARIV